MVSLFSQQEVPTFRSVLIPGKDGGSYSSVSTNFITNRRLSCI